MNSLGFHPGVSINTMPTGYTVSAGITEASLTELFSIEDREYHTNQYSIHSFFFLHDSYPLYRFTTTFSLIPTLAIGEFHPLVCGLIDPTSITFEKPVYSFSVNVDDVVIEANPSGITNCSINPSLPNGLTLSSANCKITGIPLATFPSTVFTITSSTYSISGTVRIEIIECAGSVLEIDRVYPSYLISEGYQVIDLSTNTILYEEEVSSNSITSTTVTRRFCVTSPQIKISLSSSRDYWSSNSYLRVSTRFTGEEKETHARIRFDSYLGLPNEEIIYPLYTIKAQQAWYYKMGEVPSDWTSSSMNNWNEGTYGNYPSSTNQIQLYKKSFTISNVNSIVSMVVLLRHSRGSLIYLNGHEISRLFITGDLSTSTFATGSFSGILYRTISLPVRSMSNPSIQYLQEGSNTIAISLVGMTEAQKSSTFDCVIRFTYGDSTNRAFDIDSTQTGFVGQANNLFNSDHSDYIRKDDCSSEGTITLSFTNDRREWLTSISLSNDLSDINLSPSQVTIEARNQDSTIWTSLVTLENMKWWIRGQEKRIYFVNNKSYHEYRLSNLKKIHPTQCTFVLSRLVVYSDLLPISTPALQYPSPISAYLDIEMAELTPSSSLFTDFSITPVLPSGLAIDTASGVIVGTPTQLSSSTMYTVTAHSLYGTIVTATFTLDVIICTGGKSLITLVIRTDNTPQTTQYSLHEGNTLIRQVTSLSYRNSLYYDDWCLSHSIYTLSLTDSLQDGWSYPSGLMLTVDKGAFRFDTLHLAAGSQSLPSYTRTFSSYLPFQATFTSWKILPALSTVDGWNTLSFDDSTWEETILSNLGSASTITLYCRKHFTIPSFSNYHVLNIRVYFTGGFIGYLNGQKVARMNLPETVDITTVAPIVHDTLKTSAFHILLDVSSAQEGENVLAFEVHQSEGVTASSIITFDVTGIFGVEDCSLILDSISTSASDSITSGTLDTIFSLSPLTMISIDNQVGSSFSWSFENLEGSRFNSIGFSMASSSISNLSWSLYSRESLDSEDTITIKEIVNSSMNDRTRVFFTSPISMGSFTHYQWVQDTTSSTSFSFSSLLFQYCIATGSICAKEGEYASVNEGEISPSSCPYGYTGYSYRHCSNGHFSEVQLENCKYRIPEDLFYPSSKLTFVKDVEMTSPLPTVRYIVTKYYLDEGVTLPAGLSLDEKTGAIFGKATSVSDSHVYTIYGMNERGSTNTTVLLEVRLGRCNAESHFKTTNVGETAVYECSSQGNYVGTQKRKCLSDGNWGDTTGVCVSIVLVVFWIVVVLLIIFVVFIIWRRQSKKRKVGGVSKKKVKQLQKKSPKKEVKV